MFGVFTISGLIVIGLFFLLRSVLLWYWKVNTIIEEQQTTNQLLRQILKSLQPVQEKMEGKVDEAPEGTGYLFLYHTMERFANYEVFASVGGKKYEVPLIDKTDDTRDSAKLVYLKPGKYLVEFYYLKGSDAVDLSRLPFSIDINQEVLIEPERGVIKNG